MRTSRTTRFSNDCLQVQLRANCRQRDVYVVQPLVPPVQENLFELLLMLDAARGASAAHITAVIPHFAYARSDKKDAPRISIGARLVADLLVTAGATRVLTMALHAPQVHGFFSVPVDHLNAIDVLADHFRTTDLSNTVVVSPDLGNAKMATAFARMLEVPVAAGSKQRLADDTVVIDRIVGDVHGRDVIVLDDEIATGGSIVELLRKLREHGRTPDLAGLHPRPVHRPGDRAAQAGARHRRDRRSPTLCRCRRRSSCPTSSPDRWRRCSPRRCTGSTSASRSAACSATTRRTADGLLNRRWGSARGLIVAYCGSLASITGTTHRHLAGLGEGQGQPGRQSGDEVGTAHGDRGCRR